MTRNINARALAINVKRRVKALGMEIGEFEKRIGVSTGFISRIAKKSTSPSFELIMNIANELGVSIDTLVEEMKGEKSGIELILKDDTLWSAYTKYRSDHTRKELEWLLDIYPVSEEKRKLINQNKEEIAQKYENAVGLSYSPLYTLEKTIKEVLNGNE